MHAQIQSNQTVYVQSAQLYDRLSLCITIPSMLIGSCGSILAFVSASSLVSEEMRSHMGIWLGMVGILSTLVQSCHTTLKFSTKAEMFRNVAEQYDQLLIKIQFEQIHHNEKRFIDNLEKRLLEIQSTCKYYPPIRVKSSYRQYDPL